MYVICWHSFIPVLWNVHLVYLNVRYEALQKYLVLFNSITQVLK